MLVQNPIRVERRCPRLWWAGTAVSLLASAVLVSGIGATPDRAKSAPPANPDVVVEQQEPEDEQEPSQEKTKNRDKEKSKPNRPINPDEFPFEELRKALENLPDRIDAERIEKEVRRALEQAKAGRQNVEKDVERLRKRALEALDNAKGMNDEDMKKLLKEAMEKAQKNLGDVAIDKERLEKQIREAMEKAHRQLEKGDNKLAEELFKRGRAFPRGEVLFGGEGEDAPSQGRLGIHVAGPVQALREHLDLPKGTGLVVTSVAKDSAAAKAGVKVNDIILEMNGKPVSDDIQDLQKIVEDIKANAPFDMVVLRKGKKEALKGVTLGDAPARGGRAFPGGDGRGFGRGGAGAFPGQAGQPGFAFGGAPGAVMTTVTRTNDRVNARHQEGNLVITLTGTVADGKAKIGEIHIQDGGKAERHDSVEDVPERYRDKVRSLVEMCEKGNVRIDTPRRERRPRGDTDGGGAIRS
jgi:hypothetical protein